ncbi:uncharacterized protein IAS62_001290 [Cryptococcus decagattii]|uniref:Uncharacterized protein n=1 Tax=Cryptococcus decagattii TaxID=1859122 RepID=A0ABZ2AN84_9TREE
MIIRPISKDAARRVRSTIITVKSTALKSGHRLVSEEPEGPRRRGLIVSSLGEDRDLPLVSWIFLILQPQHNLTRVIKTFVLASIILRIGISNIYHRHQC